MVDVNGFKSWLVASSNYSNATISNTISRLRRADNILPWFDDLVYIFRLEQSLAFQQLSVSVKSQVKKAVKLYFDYLAYDKEKYEFAKSQGENMKILSLFANIGVAEAYLEEVGFTVAVANELIERRARLYSEIYPNTKMICGDITDTTVFQNIITTSISAGVDVIMATPPCQGMSTAGQQAADDFRNTLICPTIEAVKAIKPRYVFLENVPMFLNTQIAVDGKQILIPDLLDIELSEDYIIRKYVINTQDYSVPQTRERAIVLMSRKGEMEWLLPGKDDHIVTMEEAIGHLPKLDPFITDISEKDLLTLFPDYYKRKEAAEKISKWHTPPHHVYRQVVAMQHTPTGCTAFDNEKYYPVKEDGTPVKGYHNTYKRQNWNTAAYTVTMDNRKISSQNNVHPGRPDGFDDDGEQLYSDARTLTLYEIMKIMSLPEDWAINTHATEAFLRRIIGEGIPPLFVKKAFSALKGEKNEYT